MRTHARTVSRIFPAMLAITLLGCAGLGAILAQVLAITTNALPVIAAIEEQVAPLILDQVDSEDAAKVREALALARQAVADLNGAAEIAQRLNDAASRKQLFEARQALIDALDHLIVVVRRYSVEAASAEQRLVAVSRPGASAVVDDGGGARAVPLAVRAGSVLLVPPAEELVGSFEE